MKRVHYLAGAVGLAPMAFAAAAPGIAHAAAAEASTGHTKSVTLHHIRGNAPRGAMLDAFTVGASSSVSPAAGNGCVGKNLSRQTGNNHSLKTWWTDEGGGKVCFGTVEEYTANFGATRNHKVRVRAYSLSTHGETRLAFSSTYGAVIQHKRPGGSIAATIPLHMEFGSPPGWTRAQICTAWVSANGATELGGICTNFRP